MTFLKQHKYIRRWFEVKEKKIEEEKAKGDGENEAEEVPTNVLKKCVAMIFWHVTASFNTYTLVKTTKREIKIDIFHI